MYIQYMYNQELMSRPKCTCTLGIFNINTGCKNVYNNVCMCLTTVCVSAYVSVYVWMCVCLFCSLAL